MGSSPSKEPHTKSCTLKIDDSSQHLLTNGTSTEVILDRKNFDFCENTFFTRYPLCLEENIEFKIKVSGGAVLRIGLLDERPNPDDFVKNSIFEIEDGFGFEDGGGSGDKSSERCLYLNQIKYLQYGAPGKPREYMPLNDDIQLWIYVIVLYGSPKISAEYDGTCIQWTTFDDTYISLADPPIEAGCGLVTESEKCITSDAIQNDHTYLICWEMRLDEAEIADKKPEHGFIRIGLLNKPTDNLASLSISEGIVADVVDSSVVWCVESAVRNYPYSGTLALSVNATEGNVTHNVLVSSVGTTITGKVKGDISSGNLWMVVELSCGSVMIKHGPNIPVEQPFGSTVLVKSFTKDQKEQALMFAIRRLEHTPSRISYGPDPTSFVVEFQDKIKDVGPLKKEITKDVRMLKETHRIQVIGAPQDITDFHLKNFFSNESKCGGGEMTAKAVDGTWIIDYESSEVARQVYMAGEYSIEGHTVIVLPYYEELGCASNYGEKPVFDMEPLQVFLEIYDDEKVSFVRERSKEVQHLKTFLKQKAKVSLQWKETEESEFLADDDDDEDDETVIYLHTDLTCKDYEKLAKWKIHAKETLDMYFAEEVRDETFQVELDRWDNALSEANALKKSYGFDLHIDDDKHTIRVISSKRADLQKISVQIGKVMPTIEKKTVVLKDDRAQKYLVLKAHGKLRDIGKIYMGTSFSEDTQKPEVTCTGPTKEIEDLHKDLLKRFMEVQVISITIQHFQEKVCNRARSELSQVLKRRGLSQYFKLNKRSLSLYMLCETHASVQLNQKQLKTCLSEVVKTEEIHLQKEHVSVCSTEKWKTFTENMEEENATCVTFQPHTNCVKVHALKTNVDKVCKNIRQFLESQSMYTEVLLVTHDIAEHLLEHGLSVRKDANFIVDMKGNVLTGKVLLKGDTETKKETRRLIVAETGTIKSQWVTVSEPGLASAIEDISTDHLAARHQGVISVDFADTLADSGVSAISVFKRCGVAVIVKQTSITQICVDVVVSAADTGMKLTSRIAQAIVKAGGRDIESECYEHMKNHTPANVGEAFSTTAGILPCCRVVHVIPPDWEGGNKNETALLKSTINSILKLADEEGYSSVAIPVMSYGSKKFPLETACEQTFEALKDYFEKVGKKHVSTVYMCDITKPAVDQLTRALEKTLKHPGWTFFKHGNPLSVEINTEVADSAPEIERNRERPKTGLRWRADQVHIQRIVTLTRDDDDDEDNAESDEEGVQQMDDIFADGLPYTIPVTDKLRLHIVKGAIESKMADVLVCPTFHFPDLSGVVAKTIASKAGQQFIQDSSQLGNLDYGEVKRVSGGSSGYSNIYLTKIETKWTDISWKRIYNVVRRSLEGASKYKQSSIVFPTFGTGMSKYPADKVAEAMAKCMTKFAAKSPNSSLKDVFIVVYHGDVKTLTTFETCIPRLFSTPPAARGARIPRRDPRKRGGKQHVRRQRPSNNNTLRKTTDRNETDDFVVFKIISKVSDETVQDSIEDLIKDQFVTKELPLDFEKDEDQLSSDENKLLESVADKHCIKIAIEVRDKKPILKMIGLKQKVRKAEEEFQNIVIGKFPETRRKKKMANYVLQTFQWYYDDNGHVKPVDVSCNLDLYMGYITGHDFTYKRGDTVYKVLVGDLKEHPVTDPNRKRQLYLKNKMAKDVALPDGWNISVSGADYEEVELSPNDPEFTDVKQKFINGGCQPKKFEKIFRIENKYLWQQYQTKKEQMEQQNRDSHVQNERQLWHGTNGDTARLVVRKGYDRGFVNVHVYGRGVYFAVGSSYSNGYAPPDQKGVRRMFLNKVLTGVYTTVDRDDGVLPPRIRNDRQCILYDSAVNNQNNASMYIIFHDTQVYPQYLIEYTL